MNIKISKLTRKNKVKISKKYKFNIKLQINNCYVDKHNKKQYNVIKGNVKEKNIIICQ